MEISFSKNTEKNWAIKKEERNILLQKTDYLLLPDVTLSEEDKNILLIYRQALRDFPDTNNSFDPFPEPPPFVS